MKLRHDKYLITRETLKKVLKILENNQFISICDGDMDNNYEVIEAYEALQKEIEYREEII